MVGKRAGKLDSPSHRHKCRGVGRKVLFVHALTGGNTGWTFLHKKSRAVSLLSVGAILQKEAVRPNALLRTGGVTE